MSYIRREDNLTIIDANAGKHSDTWARVFVLFREVWTYRELVQNLVIRDVKVRYKNSVLGVLWSLFTPLLMMVVFTVVFTVMTRTGSNLPHFPVFVLCGLLPWNFFSAAVIGSIHSVVGNANLVNRIYFPREILPLVTVLSELVNFGPALLLLFGMILIFGIPLTPWALLLPLMILIQVIFTLGIGFILATLNVFYRDTQQIMSVVMLAWFFLTPVIYPVSILPRSYEVWGITIDVWRWTHILNPMTSLIANYRVILYDGAPPAFDFLLRTAVTALALFIIGIYFFRHYSPRFAEEL